MKYYILSITGGVDPELTGPFLTEEEADREYGRVALELEQDWDSSSIFFLDINDQGEPSVHTISGAYAEALEEEARQAQEEGGAS